MGIFSPRRKAVEAQERTEPSASVSTESERGHGPWDVSEQPDLDGRIDFGALRFRVPAGYSAQYPAKVTQGKVPVIVLRGPEGALRVRVFAAPRDGGQWQQLREDVIREVTERGGSASEVEGPFGLEAHCLLPVKGPDGQQLVQPSRVVGYEGPRWVVRGTFLGPVAKEPRDDGELMDVFRDLVVVRGGEARPAGQILPLTVPTQADAPTPGSVSPDDETDEP